MATTFNVIFLGVSAIDIDPIEGNTIPTATVPAMRY